MAGVTVFKINAPLLYLMVYITEMLTKHGQCINVWLHARELKISNTLRVQTNTFTQMPLRRVWNNSIGEANLWIVA